MHIVIERILIGLAILVLMACASPKLDPAGEARTKNCVSDQQISSLSEPISLAELKKLWGPGEGQPGPRVTYRSRDHKREFFWVYYSNLNNRSDPTADDVKIDHIIRADRIKEQGVVVWIGRASDKPLADANSDHPEVSDESKAQ
jgi:hypothetical protein